MNIEGKKGWLKKEKAKLRKKLGEATKSKKLEIVKTHLDNIYQTYENLIGLIPNIEKRIEKKKKLLEEVENDTDQVVNGLNVMFKNQIKLWEAVLKDLKHLRDRPKATKLYYAKRVVSQIKKLRQRYPDE